MRNLAHWLLRAAAVADESPPAVVTPATSTGPWRGPNGDEWLRRILRGAGFAPDLPAWVAYGPAGRPAPELDGTTGGDTATPSALPVEADVRLDALGHTSPAESTGYAA